MIPEEGAVVLISLPGVSGRTEKLRPVLVLAHLPGAFQQILVAGISTRTFGLIPGWDEVVRPGQQRFVQMGLKRESSIRPSYLSARSANEVRGTIGQLPAADLKVLRDRLANLLLRFPR